MMVEELRIPLLLLALFLGAYFLNFFIFFFLKRIFRREGVTREVILAIQKGTLVLFLEIAALIGVMSIALPKNISMPLEHLLVVFIIATAGACVIVGVKRAYLFVKQHHETQAIEEISKRSFLTQMLVLYRAILFLIFVLTIASILMTFPSIKTLGIGLLGSAGIAGIALGIAARPILLNLMAGFQIAFTRSLKIGDLIVVEGVQGYVEEIFLTHVIMRTWDLRRLFIPISHFIDKTYENWSSQSTELVAISTIACDFTTPIGAIKEHFAKILSDSWLWNEKMMRVDVIEVGEGSMKIQFSMTASTPSHASSLKYYVNEKMIEFLQKEYPDSLPKLRTLQQE